jgi:sugar phosphate isomerase/epimerase
MHPRITVNEASFPKTTTLADDLRDWGLAGAARVGVHRDKLLAAGWDGGLAAIRDSGLTVTHLIHRRTFELARRDTWESGCDELVRTVDAAASLGAVCVYLTTGPAGGLEFDAAAAAFADAVAPAVAHASSCGVALLVETANAQFADIHFLHTLRDTVDAALAAGIGVCLDIHPCWTERGLRATIARGAGRIGLVQVADYEPGTHSLERSVPGDGIIPLAEILGWVAEGGYDGLFDLELRGVYEEGDVAAIRRAAVQLEPILEAL